MINRSMLQLLTIILVVLLVDCYSYKVNNRLSQLNGKTINKDNIDSRISSRRLFMAIDEIEIGDDSTNEIVDDKTDEEKGLTHGYEGKFKVGDRVRIIKHTKIYSVKQYASDGFDPFGYVGQVVSLVLYGRKFKSLCSAITPIKVEFQPNGDGIPTDMFDKKFQAHFDNEEVELIQ